MLILYTVFPYFSKEILQTYILHDIFNKLITLSDILRLETSNVIERKQGSSNNFHIIYDFSFTPIIKFCYVIDSIRNIYYNYLMIFQILMNNFNFTPNTRSPLMNNKSMLMKNEINIIAKHRALLLSKHYFTLVLSLISFYLGTMRLAVSSLYILIVLNALPPILHYAVKDYASKNTHKSLGITQETPFLLNSLKSKYKFSKLSYAANSIVYLIMVILICLWQINYSYTDHLNVFLRKIPFLTLITGLTLRFLFVVIYRIKLPYDLMHNRV